MNRLTLTDDDLKRKADELAKLKDTDQAAPCTVLFVRSLLAELCERRVQRAQDQAAKAKD